MAAPISDSNRPTTSAETYPGRGRARRWPVRTVVLALLVLPLWGAAGWFYHRLPQLAREGGVMENFQAVCLLLGAAIFLGAAVRSEPSGRRTFTGGLALFYFTMLVLEFDVRPYDVPLLQRLFNGWIRDVWLLLFWLAAGACFLRHARATWESFLDWCRHPAGWLLIIAGSLWVGSAVIDKAVLGSKNLYLEEAVEVGAAWLMLVAAWETWLLPGPSVLPGIGFDRGGAE